MKKTIGLLLLMLVAVVCSSASAEVISIRFGESGVTDGGLVDSTIRAENGRENYNYGASSTIATGWENSTDELIGFSQWKNIFGSGANLIPYGSTITNAILGMVVDSTSGSGDRNVNCYAMTTEITDMGNKNSQPAAAGEVCWNWRAYNTVAWGGDGPQAGVDYTTVGGQTVNIPYGTTTTISWTVTDIMQSWSDGADNYGFILRGDAWSGTNTRTGLNSYEASNPEYAPFLKVWYEEVPEPATMTLLLAGGGIALLRRRK
ncbi:MAG: PEP-CTERM sorting domain-containing protein [Phycisphaerae bacterium]|nr:PEP-CTERM sorting domain-containing protein [Phycisphaerae bacterium]